MCANLLPKHHRGSKRFVAHPGNTVIDVVQGCVTVVLNPN